MRPTFSKKTLLFIWYSYFIVCPGFVLYLNANFNQSLSQLEGSKLNLLQNAKGLVASGRDSRRSPGLGVKETKFRSSRISDQSRESHFPAPGLSFIICTVRGIRLNYLYSPVQLQCLCYFWLFLLLLGSVKGISLSLFSMFYLWEKWINHVKFRKISILELWGELLENGFDIQNGFDRVVNPNVDI